MKLLIPSILTLFIATEIHAQEWALDLDFGNEGSVNTYYTEELGNSIPEDLIITPENEVVGLGNYVGFGNSDMALTKHNLEGEVISSFGEDGVVLNDLFENENENWLQILRQTDGKILAGGTRVLPVMGGQTNNYLTLCRMHEDGSLDSSFGEDGIAILDAPGDSSSVFIEMCLHPDGSIFVGVMLHDLHTSAVVKYNSNGQLDTSFGEDGLAYLEFDSGQEDLRGIALQEDGKILATGYTFGFGGYDTLVFRFNSDGSPDNSFDEDGNIEFQFTEDDDEAYQILGLPNGQILVGGTFELISSSHPSFFRLNTDGSLDTSFGDNGLMIFEDVLTNEIVEMKLDPTGKIMACGSMFNGIGSAMMLLRLNEDGSRDQTFGPESNGIVMTQIGFNSGMETMKDFDFAPSGDIYAIGLMGNLFTNQGVQVLLKYGYDPMSVTSTSHDDWQVYPNPTSGHVQISSLNHNSLESVELLNSKGQLIDQKFFQYTTAIPKLRYRLPEHLPSSVYFLKLTDSKGQTSVQRIVVE